MKRIQSPLGIAALAFGIGHATAQEPSVVLKSLDGLDKRLPKVESDVGKMKKTPAMTSTIK